jgi:polysaccharide biosynthesis/export protein
LLVSAFLPVAAQTLELPGSPSEIEDYVKQRTSQNGQGATAPVSPLDRSRAAGARQDRQGGQQDDRLFPHDPADEVMEEGAMPGEVRMQRVQPTPLERDYAQRLGRPLRQFGYDLLARQGVAENGLLNGAVPDDYVLGIGDELVVTLRGQVNASWPVRIDREGRVILPNLPPLSAAGRRLDEVRADLVSRVAASFVKTEAFLSIGAVRRIGVLVAGEVRNPGRFSLTSFSSLIDALAEAQGIKKTGSLRSIRIIRAGRVIVIDLYALLLGQGSPGDLRLQDGDQIIAPGLGPTIAIAGDVIRPGIYEIGPDARISLDEALRLAGGAQRARGNRLELLRLDGAGRNQVLEMTSGKGTLLEAGDILSIALPRAAIALEGAAEQPGGRGLVQTQSLRQMLSAPYVLAENPYLPFAVIETESPVTRQRRYVPVDLNRVLSGVMDVALRERDRVILLSRNDIRYLASADVQAILRQEAPLSVRLAIDAQKRRDESLGKGGGGVPPASAIEVAQQPLARPQRHDRSAGLDRDDPAIRQEPARNLVGVYRDNTLFETDVACPALQTLAAMVSDGVQQRFALAQRIGTGNEKDMVLADIKECPATFKRHPDLLPFLLEHASLVEGEVRFPGVYPVVAGAGVEGVVQAAGGMTLDADKNAAELSMAERNQMTALTAVEFASASLSPGDVLRINAKLLAREAGAVTLRGAVLRPGRYDIHRGETLSQLLQRANGLRDDAFPYGAVFTRKRVREAEKQGFERSARELELSLPTALASNNEEVRQALPFLQGLISSLRSAEVVGRVVVEADPRTLAARPELDFPLEAGDELYIPKRPAHVTIVGEVLNPSTVMFSSGRGARDYIRMAGGETDAAKLSSAFVIYPNGESEPLRLGRFTGSDVAIPPGSTIVVPRDPKPFDFLTITRTVVSLVSDLALAAASLAVISNR